ncbi:MULTISPECIES: NAD kinase [Bacillaceae]|jgi:NAD+ kinase|uniref:NAD kinase n=1 Tax=Terribacillus saccharophilus TaxID=361277 RepID=A0A1H8C0H3_9BACI|nr:MULTISPECIES: NAD kinase [Bacillaceae]AIF66088.1 inorganic polyphosphate kinase [Terribacillus goriensis]MCM3226853.1 NAD kinase [Terribacillus saccharophilus]MEC0281224.1 NAD kinase [Terribacillus saccharophilus]MEC0289424.1 NAD kinase [Terribacillus saccharophilus]MEC0304003.1 NAD kinase [Terribacillus saccharophilus]
MKYTVLSRGDEKSNAIKETIVEHLAHFNFEYDDKEPALAISVGGDGTFLENFHTYVHRLDSTAFIGIHTGHLGFYADWVPEELEKLLLQIANKPYHIVEYPLLDISITHKDGRVDEHLALNECSVKTPDGSVVLDVSIKGEHFETFRGDGLVISTPSGSTAYNKALNGAIIHPSLASIQVTELASINNRVFRTIGSPLILPSHHPCTLRPTLDKSFLIAIDHMTENHSDIESITCSVAKQRVRFARFRPFPFWKRVHDSFIADKR